MSTGDEKQRDLPVNGRIDQLLQETFRYIHSDIAKPSCNINANPMNNTCSTISMRPVGRVFSRFTQAVGMPIQTVNAPHEMASIEMFPEFAAGLRDVEGFEYLIVLTHLDRCRHERLEVLPFLDTQPRGVFATRSPSRPNRIGLSIVQLESVDGAVLHFRGNDMLDGTPVLDIKPYVPIFDVRSTERIGWFEKRLDLLPVTVSDDRMF